MGFPLLILYIRMNGIVLLLTRLIFVIVPSLLIYLYNSTNGSMNCHLKLFLIFIGDGFVSIMLLSRRNSSRLNL